MSLVYWAVWCYSPELCLLPSLFCSTLNSGVELELSWMWVLLMFLVVPILTMPTPAKLWLFLSWVGLVVLFLR